MRLLNLICPFGALTLLGISWAFGLVKEDEILVRWAFDEGSGNIAADAYQKGLPAILNNDARWGNESDGSALSKHSLDLNGSSFAVVEDDIRLDIGLEFSLLTWFKPRGSVESGTNLFNKFDGTNSSYFSKFLSSGKSLSVSYLKPTLDFASTGEITFRPQKWNCLITTYDGLRIQSFINGKIVGQTELLLPPVNNTGNLGIGGTPFGGNLFNGWIDEMRIYSTALSFNDSVLAYGNGFGDIGAIPHFEGVRSTDQADSSIILSFLNSDGSLAEVSEVDQSTLIINGADWNSIRDINASSTHFELNVTAEEMPQRIEITVKPGTIKDENNVSVVSRSTRINYVDQVTRSENLVGWWSFENGIEGEPLSFNNQWSPNTLNPKLWLDANKSSSMDKSTSLGAAGTPEDGDTVYFWEDQSSNNHDAVRKSGSPKYRADGFDGGFPCIEPSGGSFEIANSKTEFDEWSSLTFAVAFKWTNTSTGDKLVYKGSTGWWNNSPSFYIGKFNTGAHQGTAMWVAQDGSTYNKMNGSSSTDARDESKIFLIRYDGLTLNTKYFINGNQVGNHNMNAAFSSLPQSPTSSLFVGGHYQIAELLMIESAITEIDRRLLENYLSQKYGLLSSLPLYEQDKTVTSFTNKSGGDAPLLFYGEVSLDEGGATSGSSITFDGSTNFGVIKHFDSERTFTEAESFTRADALYAWWPMDGNMSDLSGNERSASLVGQHLFRPGKFGQCLALTGDGFAQVEQNEMESISTSAPRTFAAWIKTRSRSGSIFYAGEHEDGKLWDLKVDFSSWTGGTLSLDVSGTKGLQTGGYYPVDDGKWRHVAVTYGVNSREPAVFLYVDGVAETSYPSSIDHSSSAIETAPSSLLIGANSFTGLIDEVRIYSVELNPGEIINLYREGLDSELPTLDEDYTISAWIKPDQLPGDENFEFANGRFFWRNWGSSTKLEKWPHSKKPGGIPNLDPNEKQLKEILVQPIELSVLSTEKWLPQYIGHGEDSLSISDKDGFFSDSDKTDDPKLLTSKTGGSGYSPNYQGSLSNTPIDFASSLGVSFPPNLSNPSDVPKGFTISNGFLTIPNAVSEDSGVGLYFLQAAGGGGENNIFYRF